MAGGDNLSLSTIHFPEVNKLLEIMSDENKSFYWSWAKEQILKAARKIKDSDKKQEILEAVMGNNKFTSLSIFKELRKELSLIPGFPQKLTKTRRGTTYID